jgi:hypothetical protein
VSLNQRKKTFEFATARAFISLTLLDDDECSRSVRSNILVTKKQFGIVNKREPRRIEDDENNNDVVMMKKYSFSSFKWGKMMRIFDDTKRIIAVQLVLVAIIRESRQTGIIRAYLKMRRESSMQKI